jgi:hypothetical protein
MARTGGATDLEMVIKRAEEAIEATEVTEVTEVIEVIEEIELREAIEEIETGLKDRLAKISASIVGRLGTGIIIRANECRESDKRNKCY